MKALLPALFFSFIALQAQAGDSTVCAAEENSQSIREVAVEWGPWISEPDQDPFFRKRIQNVTVAISGPRRQQVYHVIAHHSVQATRLGDQIFTSIQLSDAAEIHLSEYLGLAEGKWQGKWKNGSLVLKQGLNNQELIRLDCR